MEQQSPQQRSHHPRRAESAHGLTLIELLIVMTILVLLVTAAIPVMSPSTDQRRIREASRGLNTFLSGAQARAVRSGRPFGVRLIRLSVSTGDPEDRAACLELQYVQQPAPYAGFDSQSRVIIGTDESSGVANPNLVRLRFVRISAEIVGDGLPPKLDPDLLPPGTFRRGDLIEIAGNLYEFTDTGNGDLDELGFYTSTTGNPDGTLFATPILARVTLNYVYDNQGDRLGDPPVVGNDQTPIPYWTEPFRYKILRQPAPTSAQPYQLPEGTAIDLRASGFGSALFHKEDPDRENPVFLDATSNDEPVQIMFSPEGAVSSVSFFADPSADDENQPDVRVAGPISSDLFMLIGLRENIPAPNPAVEPEVDFTQTDRTDAEVQSGKAKINWLNGDSRWVTIGPQTGNVSTSPNAFVNPLAIYNDDTSVELHVRRDREIAAAAEFAISKTIEGGR